MKKKLFFLIVLNVFNVFSMDLYLSDGNIDENKYDTPRNSLKSDSDSGRSLPEFLSACNENSDFKNHLYKYAIKELIEKQHEERSVSRSQKKQKWLAIGIGFLTTCIPLTIAIINALEPKHEGHQIICYPCPLFNSSLP